jgi:diguanylate cyclase (GGDEF)-like protein/PAS domain S-box-containing protein
MARPSLLWSRLVDSFGTIGVRLFIAFGIVSATTVLAAAVAFVSYEGLGVTVDALTTTTLPAMEASLNVVDRSSDITAAAPAMLAAQTQADAAAVSKQIVGEHQQLMDAVARLSGHRELVVQLTGYAAQMRRQLDALAAIVDRRLYLKAALEQQMAGITVAQHDIAQSLAPLLDDAAFNLTMELSQDRSDGASDHVNHLVPGRGAELLAVEDLYEIRAESNRLTGLLTAAAIVPNEDILTPMRDSATAASEQITRASVRLSQLADSIRLRASLVALQAHMARNQTVFDLRGRELHVVAKAEAALATNRVLAEKLNAVAQQVVQDEEADARKAAAKSYAEIRLAQRLLAGIVSFSLIVAIMITWRYVGRKVVRRLSGLASVMHNLAEGNTDIVIPGREERDEIGAMAVALDVFRSHVIENRRLMAERDQQRQQAEENRRAALIVAHATQETARLRQLSDSTFEGLLIHRDGTVLDANTAFCGMTGYNLSQVRGQPLARFATTWTDALDGPAYADGAQMREIMVTMGNGETLPVEVRSRDIDYAGSPARVTALRDIRERRAAEDRIRFLAHHDALTGLANRFQLNDIATREVAAARRSGKTLAVLCMDLDRFKSVNDTVGHDGGDFLLKQVADRIRETVRSTDIVARTGGDEFVVIQTELSQASDAAQLARRLIDRLSEPYDINGQPFRIGASIGIAIHPRDGDQVDVLLKHADLALYQVKSKDRGDLCFFEAEMDALLRERRVMEQELAYAIRAGEMKLAFQPIFGTQSGEVITLEALVRWDHPRRGVLPPGLFIPLAEETNLIIPLGEWVLEAACHAAMTWQLPCRVAVNVSARQFSGSDLPGQVAKVLDRTGLPANRLELEVTESLVITNTERALEALSALKHLGVRIVLDDFGTGYSSLSYLQRFPFDKIKIDKSFIDDLASNKDARAIVNGIMEMSHQLNIDVTAEGVETSSQLALLRSGLCDEIQGFLLGRPMRSEKIKDYLAGACSVVEAEEPDTRRFDIAEVLSHEHVQGS